MILLHLNDSWRLTITNVLVSQANQLLGASYQFYRNAKTNDTIIRTVGYALPAVLHTHIQTVAPTTYFASTRMTQQTSRRRSFRATPAQALSGRVGGPVGSVSPNDLRWLYKTSEYVPSAADRNSLAVVGFNESPSQMDLTLFMRVISVLQRDATCITIQVNGGPNEPIGYRANSEVQYAGVPDPAHRL
jgi:tripeptidyl-peptidase-1